MQHPIFDHFYNIGVIPVIEIDSAQSARPLAEALLEGGLPVAEITLRTEAALDAIRLIARQESRVIVGAGTVINREQARAACEAGAVTPTEMIRAINLGLNILKFFPAEAVGGLPAIKAMSDPFPQLSFIPTGGIRLENLSEYLQMKKIHAVGGSWMAKRGMIADGKFDEIRRMAKEASDLVKEIRRTHS